jgi:hypothetical protein
MHGVIYQRIVNFMVVAAEMQGVPEEDGEIPCESERKKELL